MLARLFRLSLIFELSFGILIGVSLVMFAGWRSGGAFLLVLLLALAWRGGAIGMTYLYAHAYRSAVAAEQRIDALQAVREFLSELCAFAAVIFVQAFDAFLMRPDAPRQPAAGQMPLLLVHGYCCNRGFWWWLKPRLEARGRSVATVTLEPVLADIDSYAEQIARRVAFLRQATGAERVILIGHSMGGLACLAYLRRYGDDYVGGLITLGTPHQGSALASMGLGRNARQMELHSTWLTELAESPVTIPCIAYYSQYDNFIMPQAGAMLRGAENRALPGGLGHQAMGVSPRVLAELLAVTESAAGFARAPKESAS